MFYSNDTLFKSKKNDQQKINEIIYLWNKFIFYFIIECIIE